MEFLEAFKEAQSMGLSKEEFLQVWEWETKLRRTVQDKENWTQYLNKQLTQAANESQGSIIDPMCSQLEQNLHAVKQEFQQKSDDQLRQFLDKVNQIQLETQLQYDNLLHQIQSKFDTVCQRISTTGEFQASSLKLYLMHEVDLLKQDLLRVLDKAGLSQGVPLSLSASSSAPVVTARLEQDSSAVRKEPAPLKKVILNVKRKKNLNKLGPGTQQQTSDSGEAQEDPNAEAGSGILDSEQKSSSSGTEPWPNSADRTYAVVAASASSRPFGKPDGEGTLLNGASPWGALISDESVEATGTLAEIISGQMKWKQACLAGSNRLLSDKVKIKNKIKLKPALSKPEDYSADHKFLIAGNIQVLIPGSIFMSPFVYSEGQLCMSRVRITVDDSSQLSVAIQVSKGSYDDEIQWPVLLTGNGFIFNSNSRRYSPLWHLDSVSCQKPQEENDELIFPANVCLMTAGQKLSPVTCQDLLAKYLTKDGNLVFTWDLQGKPAEE